MELFEATFNPSNIYNMLFINVKSVLEYPSLQLLKNQNPEMYNQWKILSTNKYSYNIDEIVGNSNIDIDGLIGDSYYLKYGPLYPEFTRIIGTTIGTVTLKNGEFKRNLKSFANDDESIVLEALMEDLREIGDEVITNKGTPYMFCGHNIIGFDLPLLFRRYIKLNKDNGEIKKLPLILKRAIGLKPWECGIIDTINVWKFNGYDLSSLSLISSYLGLKKTVDLIPQDKLSKFYWDNIENDYDKTISDIKLQSATQVNLVIQLMNTLRKF